MSIKSEINAMLHDWYKYLNTVIPKGVDGQFFTDTMYSNRDRLQELRDKYPEIDSRVVENEALRKYLMKSDEEIRNDMNLYYGGITWNNYKMKSHTSYRNTSR